MGRRFSSTFLAIGLALFSRSVEGQYTSGDLMIGFENGTTKDVVLDLGAAQSFVTAQAPFAVNIANLNSALVAAFGPGPGTNGNIFAAIFGHLNSNDPNNTLYASQPHSNALSGTQQSSRSSFMTSVEGQYNSDFFVQQTRAVVQDSSQESNTYGSFVAGGKVFQNYITEVALPSATLTIDRVPPSTSGVATTTLGTIAFSFDANGNIAGATFTPAGAPSPTPTPTAPPNPSPTPVPTPTPSPTPSLTPTPSPSPDPSPTPGPSPTPSPSPSASPSPSPSPTPTPTPSPSPSPTATPLSEVRLANLSSRVDVGTGDNVAIAGIIVRGTGVKKVIVRAIQPPAQVPDGLSDPLLELFDAGGNLLARNDNWKDSQEAEIVGSNLVPPNEKDAAIIRSLEPGVYTAVMNGARNTGIGLVEVYDLNADSTAKLANISTRGFVGRGARVLIGGLILNGNATARIVLRGIGPSSGVANALQNPILSLYNSNGALIYANDNWRDHQEAEILATNLQPLDDREAAIIQTLQPGAYTAILGGAQESTGVGLIEAYRIEP